VLTFGIVEVNRAAAQAEATRILTLPDDVLVGLDMFTADIINFTTTPEGAPVVRFDSPLSVNEGDAFDVVAMITDPEDDAFTFSWDLDDDEMFDEMPGVDTYAVLEGTTDGPNALRVGIRASDGTNTNERYRTITIENVDPMITSTAPRATSVGAMYEYQMVAVDPGGVMDPLTYEVVTGPETLVVDDAGLVTWVSSDLDITLSGEAHRVVVRVADDDDGVADEEWEISVSPNRQPTAPRAVYPLDRVRLDVIPRLTVENASDPDFDSITYFFEIDRSQMFDSGDLQASGPTESGVGFTAGGRSHWGWRHHSPPQR
jgi:hypothetical protein